PHDRIHPQAEARPLFRLAQPRRRAGARRQHDRGRPVLYRVSSRSAVLGFAIIFSAGALGRFVSATYLARVRDVPQRHDPAADFTFYRFIVRFRHSNFVKFVAFTAMMSLATYLSAPFFAVFMLRDLGFSYFTYMVLQVLATLAGLFALPMWGMHADAVG